MDIGEGGDHIYSQRSFQTVFPLPPRGLGMVAVGLFILELYLVRGRSWGFSHGVKDSRCDAQRQDLAIF
ncbi:hypothetical protein TNCV_4777151 [Trichonephila clavipes]|nr:hypothetical protein TNCV_4777151 [Trichonephila clavipes]